MSSTQPMDLSRLLEVAKEAARAAGDLQRARFGDPGRLRAKGGLELVTEVDEACEALIVGRIEEAFGDHDILAEEGGARTRGSDYQWIIDPLDGTTNFAHGFGVFASSVACAFEGRVVAAACCLPLWDQLYWAARGQGAFRNGEWLRVSSEATLDRSLLATGFPYDLRTNPDNNLDNFDRVHRRARAVRRAGAAVVDLCHVASGGFDGFWELRLSPWDTAAAALLVEEAGGRLSRIDGRPWDPFQASVVATNGLIHDALLEVLAQGLADRALGSP